MHSGLYRLLTTATLALALAACTPVAQPPIASPEPEVRVDPAPEPAPNADTVLAKDAPPETVGAAKPSALPEPPDVTLAERVTPGAMVIGEAPVGSRVSVDGRVVRVSEDGRFVFGVGRDASGGIEVLVETADGQRTERRVAIDDRDYEIQRIDGLPPRKVEPSPEDQEKIVREVALLNAARAIDSPKLAFADRAVWPAIGPISGVFGSQRILNGKPKSYHSGVDVAAPTGTPVVAMLPGEVTLAETDMHFTGGTVMVDHGHGIQSLYAHLSAIDVEVGQRLDKGEQLGRIGATGRVTGPHLHLSFYWFKTKLDAALILGPMPDKVAHLTD